EWAQPHRPTSGGPLRRTELHVFDINSGQRVRIDTGPGDQYTYVAGWRRDGSELMVLRMSRDFKRLDLLTADPATGATRVVLTDTQKTFLWGNFFNYRGWRKQSGLFTMLEDGRRFIWMSERGGWSHLYLYDFDGKLLRRLTSGSWPVKRLVTVEEKAGWVYFTAHGDRQRPYDTHLYRAGLEHEAFEQLTSEPGRHAPVFSPSREFFLDSHSSLDRPPAVDLRRVDGTLLQTLTRADIAGLKTLRWAPPEEFTAKAADGSTDLYGVIHKPFDFDPKRKYPVLEFIYAGPQTTHVPRTFDGSSFALTQLGFIVVMLDARGTPERGKEFQDVVYGNLGRHEIPDHVAALKQIAKRRPYMDMTRVGVIGHSYGGYFTTRAMLLAPDLYRVGVASASAVEVYGHSSRVEPYLGLPSEDPDAYEYASNVRLAGNLEGKLLIIHGTADINAPFSQTMKMADALIRANKPFDLLVLPGVSHFPAGEAERYWAEAVRRYLQEHLKP
ncbi:MAG TPA: prolyl oligopeptidase family serine peptidase, partial [Dehalococcoidia bacterium]|nr:prolyl oligopeptidase family serine peptidase [Dehalococcoidia bacterium]